MAVSICSSLGMRARRRTLVPAERYGRIYLQDNHLCQSGDCPGWSRVPIQGDSILSTAHALVRSGACRDVLSASGAGGPFRNLTGFVEYDQLPRIVEGLLRGLAVLYEETNPDEDCLSAEGAPACDEGDEGCPCDEEAWWVENELGLGSPRDIGKRLAGTYQAMVALFLLDQPYVAPNCANTGYFPGGIRWTWGVERAPGMRGLNGFYSMFGNLDARPQWPSFYRPG